MRVLVVEDDLDVARQLADSLRQAMYVVDVVHDGEEGQFLGDTESYDVVVLDLGLPKRDGLSVLQEWRQTGRNMPVLILTTSENDEDVQRAYELNVNCYITKPVELDQFLGIVRQIDMFWLDVATLPQP